MSLLIVSRSYQTLISKKITKIEKFPEIEPTLISLRRIPMGPTWSSQQSVRALIGAWWCKFLMNWVRFGPPNCRSKLAASETFPSSEFSGDLQIIPHLLYYSPNSPCYSYLSIIPGYLGPSLESKLVRTLAGPLGMLNLSQIGFDDSNT